MPGGGFVMINAGDVVSDGHPVMRGREEMFVPLEVRFGPETAGDFAPDAPAEAKGRQVAGSGKASEGASAATVKTDSPLGAAGRTKTTPSAARPGKSI